MKIPVSKFSKFCNRCTPEVLSAYIFLGFICLIFPRLGKVWTEHDPVVWLIFLPLAALRDVASAMNLAQDHGLILVLLVGAPLTLVYWLAWWGSGRWLLRRILVHHVRG